MRTSIDCIPCFMRQALEAGRRITTDDKALGEALSRIARAVADFDLNLSPPEMGQEIHRILRQTIACEDPYYQIKKESTQLALSVVPQVMKLLDDADSAFEVAVRFAIAGNILDFALLSKSEDSRVLESFEKATLHPIDTTMVAQLEQALTQAKNVLILADNAGETVFDRLLISQLPKQLTVTYAVKGGPVINDAVKEDAIDAGIDQLATIIDNGSDAPGTILHQCSAEFRQAYEQADVVIAKGQANFETLNTASREIYFLTQMKCAVIASAYGYQVGDWLVTTTSALAKTNGEGR